MGTILGSKVTGDGKIVYTVCLENDEALQLRGYIDDIHLFSEKTAEIRTNIATRGKNNATKYFLIPREMRNGIKINSEIACQKIETKSKIIFIYIMDKFQM